MEYATFLANKSLLPCALGRQISLADVHPKLFPFQRQLVQWAARKGRCAVWADCGLGKTFIQLEWARLMGVSTLIIAPLAVAQQTRYEARKLGTDVDYVRCQDDVHGQISVTNYEMVEHFNPSAFGAVVLDESSILKSFEGKIRSRLIRMFQATPFRLCCTATPAPNDITEIVNHAEFLGIMTRSEMLAAYFVHDDKGWRLKGHAAAAFYRWLASWGMMLKTPSDIGFSDDGYVLPPLIVEPEWVDGNADAVAKARGQLFITGLQGISERSAARRITIEAKVHMAATLINGSSEQWLVWCGLNDEGRELAKIVPDSILLEGKDSLEAKIHGIGRFLDMSKRVLITKSKIAGFGMNFQGCHNVLFLGLSDSYETYYQAIRRCWRFGQASPVQVKIVLSDLERPILENVMAKERLDMTMSRNIINNVIEYERAELGLSELQQNDYQTGQRCTSEYTLLLGDCVERMKELPSDSIDFSIFSPPFLNLYTYSDSERDLGNSRTDVEFFEHFRFVLIELYRISKIGRIICIHTAQVPAKLASDGYIGLKDFRGKIIEAGIAAGFHYHGDVTVDKNPQAQAIRTHAKGLLFKQLRKDASWLRPGLADYILIFRKPGENQVPITPAISNEEWIQWAHPVWYGIRETNTLNAAQGTTDKDDRHICPLQLDVIERCIKLWSNKGEVIFSPFAGIGSEGYQAVLLERRFIGIELKPEYYGVALINLAKAVTQMTQGRLL